jgi:hypothetical protein
MGKVINSYNKIKGTSRGKCAIIFGAYINACSIYQSLLSIGYDAPIYIIEDVLGTKCLAEIAAKKASVIKRGIKQPEEAVELINEIAPSDVTKHIFFTAEEYIDSVKLAVQKGILQNALAYTGAGISNDVIFDRYKFYEFINTLKCAVTPRTIPSSEDPFRAFGEQFIVRMKRSWQGAEKLPRLSIVRGKAEFRALEQVYSESGYTRDMWCYQELLSISDKHNVSVCGWYDNHYHQYAVTRKLVQHPPKTGNGDVIETITVFPQELVSAAGTILEALDYAGPFELEFVFDLNENVYKVIELNPRYWMQHGLVNSLTNHSLVRRNIGESDINIIPARELPHRYWINTNQALFRLLKGQLSLLGYFTNCVCFPGVMASIKWAMHYKKYKKFKALQESISYASQE